MALSAEAEKIIKTGTGALAEKKAEDIVILDISKISPIADYFVIATGTTPTRCRLCQTMLSRKWRLPE